jgi:hypothetical protein
MIKLDTVERLVKLAGIIGGVTAAMGVVLQLYEINDKQKQKTIEDWQDAAVYRIIDNSKFPIRFADISRDYTSEAQKFPQDIPREKLDDPHLQLVLIRLIQSQAIMETVNGVYAARNAYDPKDQMIQTFKMMNDSNRQMAYHQQLAFQQLLQSNGPITQDQLRQKILMAGGDKAYLTDNLPTLLQQMIMQRQLSFQGDGRVILSGEMQNLKVAPPPEAARVLADLDKDMTRYILLTDPNSYVTSCYVDKNPEELRESGLYGRLSKLNIVKISDVKGAKGADGKPCVSAAKIEPAEMFFAVQGYYFAYLNNLMNSNAAK